MSGGAGAPHGITVACVQVNAGTEIAANLAAVTPLVHQARARGAHLIALPENVAMMVQGRAQILARVQPEASHPALAAFQALARETGAWLLVGSLGIRLPDAAGASDGVSGAEETNEAAEASTDTGPPAQAANRSFLIDDQGAIVARYDKIHMFDVDLGSGERYCESATFRPGTKAVVADTPWGRLGMTVCYDLRFAALFRCLAQAGARLITVPAAFTVPTGHAHWHVLLRARAIETGCYILAPGQCGRHDQDRRTFGHSLIIDPWGEILADAGDKPGVITADIDLTRVDEARRKIPSLRHDRAFTQPD